MYIILAILTFKRRGAFGLFLPNLGSIWRITASFKDGYTIEMFALPPVVIGSSGSACNN